MNKLSNLPYAIIAGAPKCGTTSLFNWLADHPEVCPAKVKETRYFIDKGYPIYDEKCNYRTGGLPGWAELFDTYQPNHKIRLEATPDYIYQEAPLTGLAGLERPPTIIFVLRKPSERIYSLFKFAQNNMAILPPKMKFQDFLELIYEEDAILKERIILKNAIAHSYYSFYIKKWIRAFGGENIHIFFFEEMISEYESFIKKICGVLHIDKSFYNNYKPNKNNETVAIRLQSFQRFNRKISSKIPDGHLKLILKKIYKKINVKKGKGQKSENDLVALKNLNLEFLPEIRELHKLVGIYQTKWR